MKPLKPQGKIIIPSNTNIWPHESAIAKILAANGYKVEFIRKSNKGCAGDFSSEIYFKIWRNY